MTLTHSGLRLPFSSFGDTIVFSFSRLRDPPHLHIACPPVLVMAVGVGHNPNPIPSVRGVDGASWKYKRPCFVAFVLQVSKHVIERHADDARYVFTNNPTGPSFGNNPKHLRPEVTVICRALLLPGNREWLTRKSACKQIGSGVLRSVEFMDVGNNWDCGPVLCEDLLAKRISLTKYLGSESCPMRRKRKPANAGK